MSHNSTLNKLGDVPFLLSGVRTFSIKERQKLKALENFFQGCQVCLLRGQLKKISIFLNEKIVCKALKTKY